MPDLRPVERFNRQMTGIETGYLKAVRKAANEQRAAILDVLMQAGAGAELLLTIRRAMDALRANTMTIAADYTRRTVEASNALAGRQVGQVSQLTGAAINFEALLALVIGEQQQLVRQAMDNLARVIDTVGVTLQTEASRLADESPKDAAARLLSPDLVDGRASAWRRSMNAISQDSQRDLWWLASGAAGVVYLAGQRETGQRWQKQAIAAIDERTTDCCLRVHGQIQPLDDPFELTGKPRYARRLQHPPFHDYCRTAEALYIKEMDSVGVTTDEMRDAARAELRAREDGSRQVISPASATSRR